MNHSICCNYISSAIIKVLLKSNYERVFTFNHIIENYLYSDNNYRGPSENFKIGF